MATMQAAPAVAVINLEADCLNSDCAALAQRLHDQLGTGRYTWPASVLPMPASIGEWEAEHRTARKRANACVRHGYTFAEVDRRQYADDVHAINTSAPARQGRPMADGYLKPLVYSALPDYPCPRHAVQTYGVLNAEGSLRAYTWMYRCGDLAMFSMILGHSDDLERHVMYLLVRGALEGQIAFGPGSAFYNLDSSGTDGLRFFKHRCGFLPTRIDWRLS